jgi:hypothetical protein
MLTIEEVAASVGTEAKSVDFFLKEGSGVVVTVT